MKSADVLRHVAAAAILVFSATGALAQHGAEPDAGKAVVSDPKNAGNRPIWRTQNVVLLQPDAVLAQLGADVEDLASYIRAVQGAAERALQGDPAPASGFFVFAVRPGKRSMLWFDFRPGLPEPIMDRLRAAILAVAPCQVRNGVMVFAINVTLWNAPPRQGLPSPAEWRAAMQGEEKSMRIESLIDRIWP